MIVSKSSRLRWMRICRSKWMKVTASLSTQTTHKMPQSQASQVQATPMQSALKTTCNQIRLARQSYIWWEAKSSRERQLSRKNCQQNLKIVSKILLRYKLKTIQNGHWPRLLTRLVNKTVKEGRSSLQGLLSWVTLQHTRSHLTVL